MKNPIIYFSDKEIAKLGLQNKCTCETQLDFSLPSFENIQYGLLQKQEFQSMQVEDDKFALWNEKSSGITVVNQDGLEFIQNLDISQTDKKTLDILVERGILAYPNND